MLLEWELLVMVLWGRGIVVAAGPRLYPAYTSFLSPSLHPFVTSSSLFTKPNTTTATCYDYSPRSSSSPLPSTQSLRHSSKTHIPSPVAPRTSYPRERLDRLALHATTRILALPPRSPKHDPSANPLSRLLGLR